MLLNNPHFPEVLLTSIPSVTATMCKAWGDQHVSQFLRSTERALSPTGRPILWLYTLERQRAVRWKCEMRTNLFTILASGAEKRLQSTLNLSKLWMHLQTAVQRGKGSNTDGWVYQKYFLARSTNESWYRTRYRILAPVVWSPVVKYSAKQLQFRSFLLT